jgi:hypothetical protein
LTDPGAHPNGAECFYGVAMRFLIVMLPVIINVPAMAEVTLTFPVSIPQECLELAQREHVPILITNRYQATKAKIKLYRLSDSDPMVLECKQAVGRLKAAMHQ